MIKEGRSKIEEWILEGVEGETFLEYIINYTRALGTISAFEARIAKALYDVQTCSCKCALTAVSPISPRRYGIICPFFPLATP